MSACVHESMWITALGLFNSHGHLLLTSYMCALMVRINIATCTFAKLQLYYNHWDKLRYKPCSNAFLTLLLHALYKCRQIR